MQLGMAVSSLLSLTVRCTFRWQKGRKDSHCLHSSVWEPRTASASRDYVIDQLVHLSIVMIRVDTIQGAHFEISC